MMSSRQPSRSNLNCSPSVSESFNRTQFNRTAYMLNRDQWREMYLVFSSCLIVVAMIALVANVYIVVLFCFRIRKKWNPTLRLTLSLAMVDCWSVMLLGIGFVLNSLLPSGLWIRLPMHLCMAILQEIFRLGGIITCALHLLFLAIHHYVSIASPNDVNQFFNPRFTRTVLIILWIVPPGALTVYFSCVPGAGIQEMVALGTNATCRNIEFLKALPFRTVFVLILFGAVGTMGILYCLMIRVLTFLQQNFRQTRGRHCESFHRRQTNIARKRRAMRTTFLILGSFLMCWVPASVIFIMTSSDLYRRSNLARNPEALFALTIFVNLLLMIKHLINPLLYAMRIPEVQRVARPSIALVRSQRTRPVNDDREFGPGRNSPIADEIAEEPLLIMNAQASYVFFDANVHSSIEDPEQEQVLL